jgi:hypothetical protein
MWLLDATKPFQPSDAPRLHAAYTAYGGPPRFWLSPSYLAHDKANRIGTLGSCLVVLRAKVLHGNPVLYLLVPPLGPGAADLIEHLRQLGVGAKLCHHDLQLLPRALAAEAKPDKGNVEWVYTAGPMRTGRAGRRERNAVNKLARLREQGLAYVRTGDRLPRHDTLAATALAKRWQQQVRRHQAEGRIVGAYEALAGQGTQHCQLLMDQQDGRVVAYSLTEEIAANQVAIVARLRDYAWLLHSDPLLGLHCRDLDHWHPGTQLTIGSAVGSKSLAAHKEKLPGEVQSLQLYHLPPARKVALAEWQAAVAA